MQWPVRRALGSSLSRARSMSDDTKELNNFVLMAKTTKGLACAALIKQVLDHPSIYVFGELLDMPNVAEVRAHTRVLNSRS